MTTTVYIYDINKKDIADFYSFPYDTQYPLGIYDKETDRLYFTQSANGGDQVFYYDIAQKETVQLTDSLFAVNHILPYGNRVFVVVAPQSSRSIILGCIDTDSKEISYWMNDGDTNVETIYLDRMSEKIYISAYSSKQKDYNKENQGNDGMIMPDGILYETTTEFKDTREIYRLEEHIIRCILKNKTKVLVGLRRKIDDKQIKSAYIDINTLEVEDFLLPSAMERGGSAFSSDGEGIYLLASPDDYERGIYYYSIREQTYTPVFVPDTSGFINSFIYFDG